MTVEQISTRVGRALVDDNLMTMDALAEAAAVAESRNVNLIRHLVRTAAVRQVDALRKIGGLAGVEFFDPAASLAPDPAAIDRLSDTVARTEVALPIRVEGARLVVAVTDPFDLAKKSLLEEEAKGPVALVLAPAVALEAAVRRAYEAPGAPEQSVALAGVGKSLGGPPVAKDSPSGEAGAFHINAMLDTLMDLGGSDLHLTTGSPPRVRINGALRDLDGYGPLKAAPLRAAIYDILTAHQREKLEDDLELDASHPLPGRGRFRVNVYFQRGSIGTVMRAIPNEIKSLPALGMPPVVREFAALPRGLVLVTGATGSGKSTTLASLVDLINETRAVHIMTIEDPIEFMHKHRRAIVNQREVGHDTKGFASALRHALRQDPDVILLGEMRDLETISTALTAAETGHLVLATLHTQDAPGTVERMIDVFPPHQQQQVRVQLAEALQGVVSQQLVPTLDGHGRVPAVEVMIVTPAIRNLIREGKVHQIRSAIQSGARYGMQSMDASLANLVRSGRVDRPVAAERVQSLDEFNNLLGGR
jgi:twitching motility protein PilT